MLKHVKGLDTLRAFAVIFVLIAHWGPHYYVYEPVGHFISRIFVPDGATGVYIFFTLSGFLITSILLNARFATDSPNRFSILKNFIARRTLRIFPIYYIFICSLLVVFNFADLRQYLVWFLTYTSNILCYKTNSWNSTSNTWTLAVEEQFYLFWPWLMLFVNRKYLKYVFTLTIAVGVITTYYTLQTKIEPFLVFNCFDSFGIGGLYAFARQGKEDTIRFEKVVRKYGPLLLIPYFYFKIAALEFNMFEGIFLKKTVDSILAIWLIVLILNNRSEATRKYLLENKALNFVGKVSYCLYLIHPYIWIYYEKYLTKVSIMCYGKPVLLAILTNSVFIYCLNLTVILTICWLSYKLIEQPIMSLKKYFNYR